jgi:hypothetical protein
MELPFMNGEEKRLEAKKNSDAKSFSTSNLDVPGTLIQVFIKNEECPEGKTEYHIIGTSNSCCDGLDFDNETLVVRYAKLINPEEWKKLNENV